MKLRWSIIFSTLLILEIGCMHKDRAGFSETILPVEPIYRSTTCMADETEPYALWIDSPADLQRKWHQIEKKHLVDASIPPPEVDFTTYGILAVYMGRRSTGGYAIELEEPSCRMVNDVAKVNIRWITPDPNALVTQMITSPCLFLKLPKKGFTVIQVVDEKGRVRASVNVGKNK